ncbi:MAG: 50S ribosomal protein L1 [Alphaproteobacteria bacterium]|nr:MAG: 50S ribosomal protein L1 [Alphaproteobacteria bacterium]
MSEKDNELYSFSSAIEKMVSTNKKRNFDESVEIGINLKLDSSKPDQKSLRSYVFLPSGTGKKVKVAVFCSDRAKFSEIKDAGADYVGAEELVEDFQKGKVDCDICLASSDSIKMVAKIGKLLGSRKMMPNPKDGTVGDDLVDLVKKFKFGGLSYKTDSNGNVYASLGKASFDVSKLLDNFMVLVRDILSKVPDSFKGGSSLFINKVWISSTMGSGSYVIDKSWLLGVLHG